MPRFEQRLPMTIALLCGLLSEQFATSGASAGSAAAAEAGPLCAELAAAAANGYAFAKDAKLEVLSAAGQGGEGPAWDPEWGILSTGDGGIHRRASDGTESIFRKNAGTNGLLFDPEGRLIACEPEQRQVTRMARDRTIEVLTDRFDGQPYNQPNDVALDSRGRIYFSDACYGGQANIRQRTADGRSIEGVYRIDEPGKVERVLGADDVERANGVLVSADDRFLFVADNCNDRLDGAHKLWRFALRGDGTVERASRTLLYDWGAGRGPDGIKQDVRGHLYVAAGTTVAKPPFEPDASRPGGIYVFHPQSGKLLGFLPVPTDEVTNCAFGGADGRDLYITAGGTLYRVRSNFAGRVWWPRPSADGKAPQASPDEQIARLRSELRSDDPAVRRAAIRSLPHNHAADVLTPELIAALKDADAEVREWAATVLGPQGAAAVDAVPQLIVQLQTDPEKKARETAARALGRIAKTVATERRAVPALEKAATDDADSVTRVVALGALALMEPDAPGRVAAVAAYMRHDDALTRMKAVHALGYLLDKAHAAGPDIARALQQATDPYQRGYIARSLGQIGAKEQLPILLAEYAKETDPRAQGEMRGAIKRLGGTVPAKSLP